jgi:hypothetical protein
MIMKSKNLWYSNLSQIKINPVTVFCIMMVIFIMCPEFCFAAGSIEEQITKVGVLGNGKLKTVGFSVATIGGSIISLIRGSVKGVIVIILVAIMAALCLEWMDGGMKLLEA